MECVVPVVGWGTSTHTGGGDWWFYIDCYGVSLVDKGWTVCPKHKCWCRCKRGGYLGEIASARYYYCNSVLTMGKK